MNSAFESLTGYLQSLEGLNPEISGYCLRQIRGWAALCPKEHFDDMAAHVEKLIELYLNSPAEIEGRQILKEYSNGLKRCAQRLVANGEIPLIEEECSEIPSASGISTSLVKYAPENLDSLTRCKILCRANLPEELTKAADAFRRRIEVVDTVFGIGFDILWTMDHALFQEWARGYLERHRGQLAPEVIRDMLGVLRRDTEISQPLREWILAWCADGELLEHWPLVTRYADRTIGKLALSRWAAHCTHPSGYSLAHLKLLVTYQRAGDTEILSWLTNTLENFGEGVERFMSLELRDTPEEEAWHHAALIVELRALAATFPVIMVTAEHILDEPDGTAKLAMAFLGIIGRGLSEWEKKINALAEKVVRRAFLIALRDGKSPVETIRKFSFGDKSAFEIICNDLDLVSRRFDSIVQREVVVRKLAVYYASYRRAPLLGIEVAKRYRHLARILHDDYLSSRLTPEEMTDLNKRGFLKDLYTMSSYAKRFLDHRRALEMTVEEMLASEMDFIHQVRTRRLEIIRELLH